MYWTWPWPRAQQSEDERMAMSGSDPRLNEWNTSEGWSEEEYLFGHYKYSSNMSSNDQSDLP